MTECARGWEVCARNVNYGNQGPDFSLFFSICSHVFLCKMSIKHSIPDARCSIYGNLGVNGTHQASPFGFSDILHPLFADLNDAIRSKAVKSQVYSVYFITFVFQLLFMDSNNYQILHNLCHEQEMCVLEDFPWDLILI